MSDTLAGAMMALKTECNLDVTQSAAVYEYIKTLESALTAARQRIAELEERAKGSEAMAQDFSKQRTTYHAWAEKDEARVAVLEAEIARVRRDHERCAQRIQQLVREDIARSAYMTGRILAECHRLIGLKTQLDTLCPTQEQGE